MFSKFVCYHGCMQEYLDFAKRIADQAGKIMRDNFVLGIDTRYKADDTPLTIADMSINQLVIDEVRSHFPDHGVLGEEDGFGTDREYLWVVDPVDGTMPYSHGLPTSVFSLALVQDGQTNVAVVNDPFTNRLYYATREGGAFVNDQPLRVNEQSELGPQVFIDVAAHFTLKNFNALDIMAQLAAKNVRVSKSFTAIYNTLPVATGQNGACVVLLESPWDGAAISLIVTEAGGKITDLAGRERLWNHAGDGFLASNGVLHEQLLGIINHTKG